MNLPNSIKTWINSLLSTSEIEVSQSDFSRPWGGFYVLTSESLINFLETFFNATQVQIDRNTPLSPKILFVSPHKRLSWQYHNRRAEIWKVIKGKVAIIRSINDNEQLQEVFIEGDEIELKCGERHRLIGLSDWGVVAEIWKHTDSSNLSDENDIIRIQDDFDRGSPIPPKGALRA